MRVQGLQCHCCNFQNVISFVCVGFRVGRLEFRAYNFIVTTFKMSIYLCVGGLGWGD